MAKIDFEKPMYVDVCGVKMKYNLKNEMFDSEVDVCKFVNDRANIEVVSIAYNSKYKYYVVFYNEVEE